MDEIVYFLYAEFGRHWGNDGTIIDPSDVHILNGKIVLINKNDDYVHIYVEGSTLILKVGYTFFDDHMFPSYLDALDAMIKKLGDMKYDYNEKNKVY